MLHLNLGRIACVLAATAACLSMAAAQEQSEQKANPETMEYLRQGSAFYLEHDFKRAIPPYQKAVDLEKEKPTLDKTLWRVLVDNLGMAYGISGDLKKAKETFEYGLSKDPKYPMFHYNMACTYAEMNDVDKAIIYLKQAFEYKENMIKGEPMPDPRTDSSFERFLNNDSLLRP
ncbi:MAG: hypothetical protein QOH70_3460 [Blastocatellia bacterium]|jgi:tetratricopeptide (TPR) repeat protein|nr:hypothetical protein [Blastocatellia bacterium]